MWRAEWADDETLTKSERLFLGCLSRFITHGGRIEWSGIGSLIQQFSADAGRRYTGRHVLRLLARCCGLGLIKRARHSAPGRPALYEAVIPGHPGHRHVKVRRRGIRPRRLLASWRSGLPEELAADGAQDAPGAAADTPERYRDRHRPTGRSGA